MLPLTAWGVEVRVPTQPPLTPRVGVSLSLLVTGGVGVLAARWASADASLAGRCGRAFYSLTVPT